MYSGTTLRHSSGNMLGAHQKIDRLARSHLRTLVPDGLLFPLTKDILHFEGNNGPDGIQRKSPGKDEPWHYYDPKNSNDSQLLVMIEDHVYNLSDALAHNNYERASFEAAWLAHAIVDGLTPAHHYPLSEKIEELWGYPKDMRLSIKQKNFIKGLGYKDTVKKNWEYWGAKGVYTTHFMFEFGFATTIVPLKTPIGKPHNYELKSVLDAGITAAFQESAQHIYDLKMYETFHKKGWTRDLARQTRQVLAPSIIKMVALAWYYAAIRAKELQGHTKILAS